MTKTISRSPVTPTGKEQYSRSPRKEGEPLKIEPPSTKLEPTTTALTETFSGSDTTTDSLDYTIVKGNTGRIYRVYSVIGKGGYGVVHKGAYEMKNGRFLLVAIKSENTESLQVEVQVLLKMKDGTHFCSVFDEGFDPYSQTRFMVMTLVGDNLSSLRRHFGWFTWGTVFRVGIQTLHAIEELHEKGFLSRDVKPSNFAVGHPQALRRLVYMLDFGIARTYLDENGRPLPRRQNTSFRGTSRYCALPQHKEADQCRRDDVESWFYLIVELTAGRLPWACYSRTEKDKIAESKRKARSTERRTFLAHCPSQYELVMDVIDQWSFDTVPDYDGLYVILARLLDVIKVKFEDPYDWEALERYQLLPAVITSDGEKPNLFEHCIFVNHDELQRIVEPSPALVNE